MSVTSLPRGPLSVIVLFCGSTAVTVAMAVTCRAPATAGEAELLAGLGLAPSTEPWAAKGCEACRQTGYRGRTGIYELLTVDDELRRLVHAGAAERALRDHATAHGMTRRECR